MKFTYWKTGKRVYVNDIHGMKEFHGKVYFKDSDGKAELNVIGAFLGEKTEEEIFELLRTKHNFNVELMTFEEMVKIFEGTSFAKKGVVKTIAGAIKKAPIGKKELEEQEEMDLTTIEIPEPVTIRIDHREPRELSNLLSAHPNIKVSIESLDLGDIIINDTIIIERKNCGEREGSTDFENSTIDKEKRLFNQSERLKLQDDYIPIIILEGDCYGNARRMSRQQIDGAISFLVSIQRISVWNTRDLSHTAYVIAKLARHDKSGLGYEIALRSKKPDNLLDRKSFVLEGISGISAKMAKTLLEHFGSVRNVINATEKELTMIKGLGKKRIAEILETLGSEE